MNHKIWSLQNVRLDIWGPAKRQWHEPPVSKIKEYPLGAKCDCLILSSEYIKGVLYHAKEVFEALIKVQYIINCKLISEILRF